MTMLPENNPAVPKPASARPTMKALEFGADAVTMLPSSNNATAVRYVYFTEKIV